MQKIFVILFFILLIISSRTVFASDYSCSYKWNEEAQVFTVIKKQGFYEWVTQNNLRFDLKVLSENNNQLILGEVFVYSKESGKAMYILFIDKIALKFRSGNIFEPNFPQASPYTTGDCIKIN